MPLHPSETKILEKLTGSFTLSNAETGKLQQIANRHPYFGAVHYFLARQAAQNHSPEFELYIQKAALHFANPLWLQYNLQKNEFPVDDIYEIQHKDVTPADELFLKDDAVLHDVSENSLPESTGADDIVSDINIEETLPEYLKHAETEAEKGNEESDNLIANRLSHLMQQQAAEINKLPDGEASLPVEIQQHYQSDYFASQGIKLDAENIDNDQLGTKLKKFTDWLRQMKRINPNPVNLETDEKAEQLIQHIANHSNEANEVITETMADVLIKQKKTEQAIEIYKKLSLSDPSKEAYFAAKIEEIKNLS